LILSTEEIEEGVGELRTLSWCSAKEIDQYKKNRNYYNPLSSIFFMTAFIILTSLSLGTSFGRICCAIKMFLSVSTDILSMPSSKHSILASSQWSL
jgi:hypothetical protein